uniref:Uncharacterized protein n=1 Tax=Phenylobacterium glaciei TaxID=2803784 RepID=A0A974P0J6_9CAUL|nr:hypothetical protein JKL49_16520 [Phenylobacterium glaciei]
METPPAFSALVSLGWLLALVELLVILALLARRAAPARTPTLRSSPGSTPRSWSSPRPRPRLSSPISTRPATTCCGPSIRCWATCCGSARDSRPRSASSERWGAGQARPAHPPAAAHLAAGPAAALTTLTANGPQVIVNLQNAGHGPHDGHADPGHGDHGAKPEPSLEDRLAEVRAAAVVFAEYWNDRSARLANLQSARDLLNRRGDLPADLEAARRGDRRPKTGGRGGDATSHRGVHTS